MPERVRGNRRAFAVAAGAVLVISLFFLTYFVLGDDSSDEAAANLRLVSVIFRHGDRTPTDTYPNDPYGDGSHWPQGWGALTKLGMRQIYSLGKSLRNRYQEFLSETYSPGDVYVVSSDHDRCLMSAQLCLAGLYPPKGNQIWNNDLPWQPIPVHTTPKHLDQLIVMRKQCPSYNKALNETLSSDYVTKINAENADLYKYLTEKSGKSVKDVLAVEGLYNTLEIEERNNLKLPSWTEGVYPERMKALASLSLALFTQSDLQKRLKGGPLVGDIVRHASQKALDILDPNRKMFLYSGHDLNLVSTFRLLGFDEPMKPDYGAALFFELRRSRDDGEHYMEVLYSKNAESEPERVSIPDCGEPCTLRAFVKLTEPRIPKDWDRECQI